MAGGHLVLVLAVLRLRAASNEGPSVQGKRGQGCCVRLVEVPRSIPGRRTAIDVEPDLDLGEQQLQLAHELRRAGRLQICYCE